MAEKRAKQFFDFKVTALEYLTNKKMFITGLSVKIKKIAVFYKIFNKNGVIMFWNANSGEVIGAVKESYQQVTKLYLDEAREILVGGFYSGEIKVKIKFLFIKLTDFCLRFGKLEKFPKKFKMN